MTDTAVTSPTARLADGVLVINLDHRPERLERFAEAAAALPWLSGWQRLPAVNGVELPGYGRAPWFRGRKRDKGWAGRAGCTLSHRHAIGKAKAAGWKSVLIMEDDVQFGPEFAHDIAAFLNATRDPQPPWDLIYLGASNPIGPCRKLQDLSGNRARYEIFGCNGTFAYLLHHTTFDWILDRLPDEFSVWPWVYQHRAIDRWYARNLSKHFSVQAVSPNLIGHYTSFSDIGQGAGADLPVAPEDDAPAAVLRPSSPSGFRIKSAILRGKLFFSRAVTALRLPLARRCGF